MCHGKQSPQPRCTDAADPESRASYESRSSLRRTENSNTNDLDERLGRNYLVARLNAHISRIVQAEPAWTHDIVKLHKCIWFQAQKFCCDLHSWFDGCRQPETNASQERHDRVQRSLNIGHCINIRPRGVAVDLRVLNRLVG